MTLHPPELPEPSIPVTPHRTAVPALESPVAGPPVAAPPCSIGIAAPTLNAERSAAAAAGRARGAGGVAGPVTAVGGAARDDRVLAHRALVGHIVREVISRLPSHVDRGDLLSAGFVALTAAAGSWQDHRGVPFARYAALRIRGAVTDELRSMDWASRGVRSRARAIADARAALQSQHGRAGTDAEVQTLTGLSPAELEASAADLTRAAVLSLHTPAGADSAAVLASPAPNPADLLVQREALGYLDDAIEELPERLRFVVRRYFFDQRPMAELAAELGVTDSRISQLRAEAVRLLRAGLHEPLHDTPEPPPSATTSATTFGPRVVTARQAYIAAVAARSTTTARLRHTTALGEPHPGTQPQHSYGLVPTLNLDDAS